MNGDKSKYWKVNGCKCCEPSPGKDKRRERRLHKRWWYRFLDKFIDTDRPFYKKR